MLASEAWTEIASPLLQEMIAGISGRLTKGIYHHGMMTKDFSGQNSLIYIGYQKALMEFNNHLQEHVRLRDKMIKDRKEEAVAEKAPMVNPFMEELNVEDQDY